MPSSKHKRKRQTRLNLQPLPSSSPAAKDYHPQIQDRAAAVRLDDSRNRAKRQRLQEDEDRSLYGLATPIHTSQLDGPVARSSDNMSSSPHPRSQKRQRQQRLDFSNAIPSSPKSHDSDSDSDVLPTQRSRKSRKQGFMSSQSQSSRQVRMISPASEQDLEELAMTQIESEEDDMPTSAGIRRRRPPASHGHDDSAEERNHGTVPTSKRSRLQQQSGESDEDDDEEAPVSSRKRLKRRTKLTEVEKQDLDSDLEFLGNSSDIAVDSPRQPRSTQNKQKSARAAALEALKRKRAGQPIAPAAVDEEIDSDEAAVDSNSSSELDSDNDERASTIPTSSSRAMFEADEDDEEFLDDDVEDGDLGVPDVPIEFTRYASMKAKDLFKHAIEWMVQKKINPAFRAEDELYGLAFQKLNDEISGLVNSKFASSAWTASFRQSMTARPEIDINEMPSDSAALLDHCEACNRKGHPSSYEVRFYGKPYHPDSLDSVEQEDEDDSDDSEDDTRGDHPAIDYRGNKVPPSNKVYRVGRFCMANAETAHELQHWKRHLYDWVVNWLHNAKETKASKIVERDSWSTKKRRKHANKVADRMNEQGVVRQLWKEFSATIARARESKQRYQ